MIQMIAIDMDGTLLDHELNISPRAIEALAEATRRGVVVVIATGRMFGSAVHFVDKLNLDAPLITYNGALIQAMVSGKTYLHRPMRYEDAWQALEIIDRYDVSLCMYFDDKLYVREIDTRVQGYMDIGKVDAYPVGNLFKFLSGEAQKIVKTGVVGMPVYPAQYFSCDEIHSQNDNCIESCDSENVLVGPTKMLLIGDPAYLPILKKELLQKFQDTLYIAGSFALSGAHAQGCFQSQRSQGVGKMYGMPRESILAVGDSYNDLK